MAIIYTDNINGNDSTGTGSAAAPYQTILKATEIAQNNDEIRVAGGQWVTSSATITLTHGSYGATFSSDVSSELTRLDNTEAIKQLITIDDGQWGYDKAFMSLCELSVDGLTADTTSLWQGPTGTYSFKYLDAYHYDDPGYTLDPGDTVHSNLNDKTGIKISGGWDLSTESNANGWTIRGIQYGSKTTVLSSTPFINFQTAKYFVRDLEFDKFAIEGVGAFNRQSGMSYTMKRLSVNRSYYVFGTSNHNVYTPAAGGAELLCNEPRGLNASWNAGYGDFSTTQLTAVWENVYVNTADASTNVGFPPNQRVNNMAETPFTQTVTNAHLRTNTSGPFYFTSLCNGANIGKVEIIDTYNFYSNDSTPKAIKIAQSGGAGFYIGTLNILGPYASDTPYMWTQYGGRGPQDRSDATLTTNGTYIGAINGGFLGTYGSGNAIGEYATQFFGGALINDNGTEWRMSAKSKLYRRNTTEFDTGDSSLEVRSGKSYQGVDNSRIIIAVLDRPTVAGEYRVTIRAKKDAGANSWNGVELGLSFSELVTVSTTGSIGTSWSDITFTFNTDDYPWFFENVSKAHPILVAPYFSGFNQDPTASYYIDSVSMEYIIP